MQIKKEDEILSISIFVIGEGFGKLISANYSIVTNQGVCFLP
jgi:hypothetical protein